MRAREFLLIFQRAKFVNRIGYAHKSLPVHFGPGLGEKGVKLVRGMFCCVCHALPANVRRFDRATPPQMCTENPENPPSRFSDAGRLKCATSCLFPNTFGPTSRSRETIRSQLISPFRLFATCVGGREAEWL